MDIIKGIVTWVGMRKDGMFAVAVEVPTKEAFYGEIVYERVFINFGKKDITKNKAFVIGKELDIPSSML